MRKISLNYSWMIVAIVAAGCVFPRIDNCVHAQNRSSSMREAFLKKFLQHYAGDDDEINKTSFFAAFVDLKDDGMQEVIVYFSGRHWCGTGGCHTLILAPDGASYKVITKITVTWAPIRVLTTKSNGWHDLGVWVGEEAFYPGMKRKFRLMEGSILGIHPFPRPSGYVRKWKEKW